VLLTEGKYCPQHQPKQATFNTSPEQHKYYTSMTHKRWREYILNRDPLCMSCLKKDILTPSIIAHHVDGDWQNIDLDNGEGICAACHTPTFHKGEEDKKNEAGLYTPRGYGA